MPKQSPFEVAGLEIARSRLESTKQKEALSSKADEFLSAWKEGFTPEDAALYPIQSESNISLTDPKIAGLGNNPMLFAELTNCRDSRMVRNTVSNTRWSRYWCVTDIQTPTPEQLSERTKMETMRIKVQRQRNLWDAFESNARATATVEEHWKNWSK